LISVITPVFNGAEFLAELIDSVRAQDYPDIEHLVIDDGSTDDGATVGVLERFPHLRWWSRPNRGQYETLNEGLREARGEIVTIISADDRAVAPRAFSTAAALLRERQDLDMVYGRVRHIDARGESLPFENFVEPRGPFAPWLLRHRSCIYHCAMFVRRPLIVDRGVWFDPALRYLGDWDWIGRLLATGHTIGFVDETLAEYRNHQAQVTVGTDESAWRGEAREICRRSGARPWLCMLLRRLYGFRHRTYRACWLLRTGGPTLLAARVWRGARRLG
jgi:glycosyltransferase involved in cell wall biosynthesis